MSTVISAIELSRRINEYESGEMAGMDIVHLFSDLVQTGVIHSLQGHYQRTASHLVDQGYLTVDGRVSGEVVE